MTTQTIFVFYESRSMQLTKYLYSNNYTQRYMGEIVWFSSIVKYLMSHGYPVLICTSKASFDLALDFCVKEHMDYRLILDYDTLSANTYLIDQHLISLYALCFWGKTRREISKMGISPAGRSLDLQRVITPFPTFKTGRTGNSYLGFNIGELCDKAEKRTYEPKGLLWGKEIGLIDTSLVKRLHQDHGIEFYSCYAEQSISLPGVENLGRLGRSDWHQLLHDCSFVLGFGMPKLGTTILEALYHGTPLFAPACQVPEALHGSKNIYLTDQIKTATLANALNECVFAKDDEPTAVMLDEGLFVKRITKIFRLMTRDQIRKANEMLAAYCLCDKVLIISADDGARLMSERGVPVFRKQSHVRELTAAGDFVCLEVCFEPVVLNSTYCQLRIRDERGKYLSSEPSGRLVFSRDTPKEWETFWARRIAGVDFSDASTATVEDCRGRDIFEPCNVDVIVEDHGQHPLFDFIFADSSSSLVQ